MRRSIITAAAALALSTAMSSPDARAQETTLGRWCDKAIPSMPSIWSTITITVQADGSVAATVNYRDGSVGDRVLTETGGGVMMVEGSGSGDRYRIVPSTGDLQLLDNDGLIRTAQRLENTPQAGECGG